MVSGLNKRIVRIQLNYRCFGLKELRGVHSYASALPLDDVVEFREIKRTEVVVLEVGRVVALGDFLVLPKRSGISLSNHVCVDDWDGVVLGDTDSGKKDEGK